MPQCIIIREFPMEHKLATYMFYINRMATSPITERSKQQEWNIILPIAKNGGIPLHIIHNLKDKLLNKTKNKNSSTQTQTKKSVPLLQIIAHLYVRLLIYPKTPI